MKGTTVLTFGLLLSTLTIAGCGDDGSPTQQTRAGQTASQMVSAAEGGTFDALGATLVIAPGALAADTEVSLAVESASSVPSGDAVLGDIFVYGPSGLTFSTPATMTLPFDTGSLPAGATAQISVLDGDAWVALDGSAVSGDTITGQTTHFSRFAVTFIGGIQTSGSCAGLEFTPCGGDISGTWTFGDICAALLGSMNPNCPGQESTYDMNYSGTFTFGDGGAFSAALVSTSVVETTTPKTCLPSGTTCGDYAEGATDTGDSCVVQDTSEGADDSVGTWTSTGTTLTITTQNRDNGANETQNIEYCVTGDSAVLRIDIMGGAAGFFIYELER